MVPALIVIAVISWFFLGFRAFFSFNLMIIGIGATLAGFYGDEFFLFPGIAMLVTGLLINFITSLRIERSARGQYMLYLFLYGLFMFLKIIMICTIIAIPFVSAISAMSHEYREMIVVNCIGRDTGKRVVVDTTTMKGTNGRKYKRYNDSY